MSRIHYYVHGRGRGHASRSRTVIEHLAARGHEVTAFVGEDARALLHDTVETRPIRSLLPGSGLRGGALLASRVRDAAKALRHERADLVIADGDLPGLLAARATGRPSIAVGHGLVFLCCDRPPGLPAAPWRREALKAGASTVGAHRRVAVNFVPLPVRRGRLARPALSLPPAIERTSQSPVLCYFRDGAPKAVLRMLLDLPSPVILFCATPPPVPGIDHRPLSRAEFVAVLRRARAVVATAGSQLISECVAMGVPLLAVHAADDDEQILNVGMLRHAGLGDGCPLPALDEARLRALLDRSATTPSDRGLGSTWSAPDVATVVGEEVGVLVGGIA